MKIRVMVGVGERRGKDKKKIKKEEERGPREREIPNFK